MKKNFLAFAVLILIGLYSCTSKPKETKTTTDPRDTVVSIFVQQPDGSFKKRDSVHMQK
jgi:hypothetical protein